MSKADVTLIVDRSGSMAAIRDASESGVNEFIAKQVAGGIPTAVTLIDFDDVTEIKFTGVPAKDAPKYSLQPRGMTALLDAIGRGIKTTGERLAAMAEVDRPDKVVVVIVTDGLENASKEYNRSAIQSMITHQRTKYSWEFVFMGTEEAAIKDAVAMGVPLSNTMKYASNLIGSSSAFASAAINTLSYTSGAVHDAHFTEADKEKQKQAGA